MPAYLSMVIGLEVSEIQAGERRHLTRIARDTGLFMAGFATVFVRLGVSATTIGGAVLRNHLLLTRV